jgi:glycosyltransferase involved in cell wall biosynthesis
LFSQIKQAFSKFKKPYEIIFIDDGSTDSSLSILKSFEKESKDVKVFSFRKNLGKSSIYTFGFQKAQGKYVATMDADLQDSPRDLLELYKRISKGDLDIISSWRKKRRDNFIKVILSKIFNRLVCFVFKINIHDLNSGLKIYKQEVAKNLNLYGGMYRFIPLLAKELGYNVGEKVVSHFPRKYGESKYKSTKVFSDITDLATVYFLTRYVGRPLHFFGRVGGAIFLFGIVILLYLSFLHFLGQPIGRRPLLFLGMLLVLSGIQVALTGLIADLIVNSNKNQELETFLRYETKRTSRSS